MWEGAPREKKRYRETLKRTIGTLGRKRERESEKGKNIARIIRREFEEIFLIMCCGFCFRSGYVKTGVCEGLDCSSCVVFLPLKTGHGVCVCFVDV